MNYKNFTPIHSCNSQSVYEDFSARSAERHAVGPLQLTSCDHITTSNISINMPALMFCYDVLILHIVIMACVLALRD